MDSGARGLASKLRNKLGRGKKQQQDWFYWNRRVRRAVERRMGVKTSQFQTRWRKKRQLAVLAKQADKEEGQIGRTKRKREEQRQRARELSG